MAVMGQQLLSLVPSVALSILSNNRFGIALKGLLGTRCYFAAEHVPTGLKGRPLKSSKKHKKIDEDSIDLGGAENLVVTNLVKKDVVSMEFYSQFDTLVFLLLLPVFNVLLGEIMEQYERPVDHLAIVLSISCFFGSLWMLMKVDVLSFYTSGADKVYACFFGLVAFVVALVSLTQLPQWLLGFDIESAAHAVGPLMVELIKSRRPSAQDIPDVVFPASTLQLALSVVAGLVSMVLFAPCLRFVRAYWQQHNIPDWATDHIRGDILLRIRLNLHLLLPLAAALLWVKPVSEMLAVTPRELVFLQAAALLTTAVVQVSNVRALVQLFSDTALTSWHQIKHGLVGSKKESRASAAELIRVNCRVVYLLIVKAAVQSLAPAGIFLGLGLLQLYCALHPGMSATSDANGLLLSVSGFLAWWAGMAWFSFCALDLWLFRTGTLQN